MKRNSLAIWGIILMAVLCMAAILLSACAATKTNLNTKPNLNDYTLADLIIGSIEINATPEKVFNYVADYRNQVNYIPGFKSVEHVRGQGSGLIFNWTMESNGKLRAGQTVYLDYVPNQKLVLIGGGNGGGDWGHWTLLFFLNQSGGTTLVVVIQHSWEVPEEYRLARSSVSVQLHEFQQTMLKNIKAAVEKI